MDVTLAVLAEDVSRANGALVAGALTRVAALKGVDLAVSVVEVDQATPFAALAAALAQGPHGIVLVASDTVPAQLPEGIRRAATPRREDGRDALSGSDFASLGAGATVVTNTAARAAQLRRLVSGVDVHVMNGARPQLLLAQVGDEAQAAMVDIASMRRLGLVERVNHVFSLEDVIPGPCQAAAELFVADSAPDGLLLALSSMNHEPSRIAVDAEREVRELVAQLGDVPLSVHATVAGSVLQIEARVTSQSGALQLSERCSVAVVDAHAGAKSVAYGLMGRGAASVARS